MSDTLEKFQFTTDPAAKTPLVDELYAKLKAIEAELEARLAPARAYYEAAVNDPKLLAARKDIKEINAKLLPVKNELAALARARGAKSIKLEQGTYNSK
jgi:hypothetical protein